MKQVGIVIAKQRSDELVEVKVSPSADSPIRMTCIYLPLQIRKALNTGASLYHHFNPNNRGCGCVHA